LLVLSSRVVCIQTYLGIWRGEKENTNSGLHETSKDSNQIKPNTLIHSQAFVVFFFFFFSSSLQSRTFDSNLHTRGDLVWVSTYFSIIMAFRQKLFNNTTISTPFTNPHMGFARFFSKSIPYEGK
ncbi:hypothetical protein TorRG33x02_130650, partial [Trema orientale]